MIKSLFWPVTIVVLLIALTAIGFYVQANAYGNRSGDSFALRLPWQAEVRLTATATKTPTPPFTPTATPTPLRPLPTFTPTATASLSSQENVISAGAPSDAAQSNPPLALSEKLIKVARGYGLDPMGRFVVVDQNLQRMHIVENGVEVRTLLVSTGDPDNHFHTPAWSGVIGEFWGTFSARGVWADNAWYLFKLNGGGTILIHGAPYTLRNGVKEYQGLDVLGLYPASRGCIRLLPEDAQWFTDWQPKGVPIVILPWDGGTARQG